MDYSQVQANMENMVKLFDTKMAEFQNELKQAARKNPGTIAALNTEFLSFKAFVCNGLSLLRAEVETLAKGVDRLEMHSRRKILLVHGVPEKNAEDTPAQVVAALAGKIKGVGLSKKCIRAYHRMGRPKVNKPRPIVVKFADGAIRDEVWKGKAALKGTGTTLSEFLTKSRHSAFKAAREKFGISNCWTQGGWIFIKTPDGLRHKVESKAEVSGISVPTTVPNVSANS